MLYLFNLISLVFGSAPQSEFVFILGLQTIYLFVRSSICEHDSVQTINNRKLTFCKPIYINK